MKKIYILFILSLCDPFAFGQQSAMLEKYRSMALEYSHDLKAAEKNLAASIELEKSARADLKPKLSGDANFQYTGNPLEINLNLPGFHIHIITPCPVIPPSRLKSICQFPHIRFPSRRNFATFTLFLQ